MMLFRLVTPNNSTVQREPGGLWINTDHIITVREIRGRPVDDEPLALEIQLIGDRAPLKVNADSYGRGAAERVLAWLQSQENLPQAEVPVPLDKRTPVKKPEPAKV